MMKKILLLAFACLFLISANASAEIKLKALAKKKWTLVESDNFKIITDLSAKKAKVTSEQLEQYRAFSALWLNAKPKNANASKMVLFMTEKTSTWQAMGLNKNWVSLYANRKGLGSQLFVNVRGLFGNSLRKSNPGRSVVFNSIAQQLLGNVGIGSEYPLWFRTGFAYYLATYTEPKGQIMLGSVDAYSDRIKTLVHHGGGLIKFDTESLFSQKKEIQKAPGQSTDRWLRDVNKFYMQSFLAVHYMYSDNELRGQMFQYVNAVANGDSEEIAMQKTFARSFSEFDKEFRVYSTSTRLTARVMDKEQILKLLTLPTQYKVSQIDDAEFFRFFATAVLELSEESMPSPDKESFLKAYKKRYLSDSEAVL